MTGARTQRKLKDHGWRAEFYYARLAVLPRGLSDTVFQHGDTPSFTVDSARRTEKAYNEVGHHGISDQEILDHEQRK